jgi:quercetin dioxygenase-like cupin family protein
MRIAAIFVALVLCFTLHTGAQNPATKKGPDPGVKPNRLIDRAEVRVLHVDLAPNAVRSVHQHDDVRFHLFLPVSGKIELTIGSEKPVEAPPGQAFFMEKGTPHGFRNLGSTPAVVMEVFVKDSASTAKASVTEADAVRLAQALAGVSER